MRMLEHRCVPLLLGLIVASSVAHEPTRETHRFGTKRPDPDAPRLELRITDEATGEPVPARFSLTVDGERYEPTAIGPNGLRFVSIHEGKGQRRTITYARGEGPVTVELPEGAEHVQVDAARGLSWLPGSAEERVSDGTIELAIELRRWSSIEEEGWRPADAHLHYNRMDPADDPRWLTMLAADGLSMGHLMILRGGNGGAGVWANQHAFGSEGRAHRNERTLVPGEEYRDPSQGHINLLGLDRVIEPISTGGLGRGSPPENYPPFARVLRRARNQGGLAGIAHGAKLGAHPTALADSLLGAVDFWEISNGFIYRPQWWYRLMSCGVVLPPLAGTDLPNYPERERWQPFLGSVRTYVNTDGEPGFEAWKRAVRKGRTFITSGPVLRFSVEDAGPGGTVRLPAGGGRVTVRAELASPRPLDALQIIRDGEPLELEIRKEREGRIHRWKIRKPIEVSDSAWIAARGRGARIETQNRRARAHTAAVRVLVGDQPLRSPADAAAIRRILRNQREFYDAEGRYEKREHRREVQALFDRAIAELESRLEP